MARALSKELLLASSNFVTKAKQLYCLDLDSIAERYSSLTENLTGKIYFFSSSGRAELIGNHTDHNNGLVIASCIDLDVVGAVVKTSEQAVTIRSAGFPEFRVSLDDLNLDETLQGTSVALLQGIIKGYIDRGHTVGGFIMNAHSNIFKGAGVSSSAAFELLLCEIFNVLYNDSKIDFVEKAIISQFAENVYFGKPSGLMDQLTISRGGVSYMDFADGKMPKTKNAPWNMDEISLVIINCGGDHCNLTHEYAQIREEMNEIASFFGKKVLREVEYKSFLGSISEFKQKYSGRAILRAIHFFQENNRVNQAYEALSCQNAEDFLQLINESGLSSYTLLQNCYPAGDKMQTVPLALAIVKLNADTLASRVHGGGFAGTILTMVKKENSSKYVEEMNKLFGKQNVFLLAIRKSGATLVGTDFYG